MAGLTAWKWVAFAVYYKQYSDWGWDARRLMNCAWESAVQADRCIGNFGHGLMVAGALAHVDKKCGCPLRR